MKRIILWIVLLGGIHWGGLACSALNDGEADPDTATDGDTDSDSDGDSDGDADSDSNEPMDHGEGLDVIWATVHDNVHSFNAWAAEMDSGGNLIIAGKVDADEPSDYDSGDPPQGNLFVAKYSGTGKQLWLREYEYNEAWVRSLIVDGDDNIIFSGDFKGTLSFGGDIFQKDGELNGMYIAKLAPDGTHLYSKMAGEEHRAVSQALAVRPDGTIILAGTVGGVWEMNDRWLFSFGRSRYVVMHFGPDLALEQLWEVPEMDHFASVNGLAVTDEGEVVIGGSGYGVLNLGGVIQTGDEDSFVFVAKFDEHGTLLWQRRFDTGELSWVADLKVGSSGDIYLTGSFNKWVNFGGGVINNPSNFDDIFLTKLDRDGAHLWSRGFGGEGFDHGRHLSLDAEENLLITGTFSGSVDFGGASIQSASQSYGDGFIAQYNREGAMLWSQGFGSPESYTHGRANFALDGGEILSVGHFSSSLKLGDISLSDSGAPEAVYIARFVIDPKAQADAQPFVPNTGDLQETVVDGEYISNELSNVRASCEYDPIAEVSGWAYCIQRENGSWEITPGVAPSLDDICSSENSPVISNTAASVTLEGLQENWGVASGRVALQSTVAESIVGAPRVEVVDSSFHLLGIAPQLDVTEVAGEYEFVLSWTDAFPCDYEYATAIRVAFEVDCAGKLRSVESFSTHTWCRMDDTCARYGWVTGDATCYRVHVSLLPLSSF